MSGLADSLNSLTDDFRSNSFVKANGKAKDSVFRILFEDKEYLLQLYQTLHPEDITVSVNDLENVTTQQVILNGLYNDLGFIVEDKLMILVEAQSTWSDNILIRSLIYAANTYYTYLASDWHSVYRSTRVKIPKPELYVVYTGKPMRNVESINLSEQFFDGEDLDINVRVHIIEYKQNDRDILNQYIRFTQIFDDQRQKTGLTVLTVKEAIRRCLAEGILVDFLTKHESEVEIAMFDLWNQEKITEGYVREQVEEARAEARAEALEEGAKQTAVEMSKEGIPIETIAKIVKQPMEVVLQWVVDQV